MPLSDGWVRVILDNYLSYTLQVLVSIYLIRVEDTGSRVFMAENTSTTVKPLNNEALYYLLKPLK